MFSLAKFRYITRDPSEQQMEYFSFPNFKAVGAGYRRDSQ